MCSKISNSDHDKNNAHVTNILPILNLTLIAHYFLSPNVTANSLLMETSIRRTRGVGPSPALFNQTSYKTDTSPP